MNTPAEIFLVACVTGGLAILVVLGPGYLLWLARGYRQALDESPGSPTALPHVDVIVPVSNEARLISSKLRNLQGLRYPRELVSILVVDGASADGTDSLVDDLARGDARFTLLRVETADKIIQLNAALERGTAPLIVVTDADAELPSDILRELVDVVRRHPGVSVVGTALRPSTSCRLEQLHWRISNCVRRLESRRGSASIVVAPCYLFRRSLVERFPPDVVADDLYVSFAAAVAGDRVGFADVEVVELRSPQHVGELFAHKRRKADAYFRELFRFAPAIGRMPAAIRVGFIWRGLQLTIAPVLGAASTLGLVLQLTTRPWLAAAAVLLSAACLVGWRRSVGLPALGSLRLAAFLTLVLLSALARYPWSRQTASFPKVASPGV